uniref:Polyprotein n=1 Tax=Ulva picorna-like virus 4 TaxID=3051532 RepID=A0A9Y1YTH1_9VIRU|nr:MAG: polyprotein [Ulva picorna-like virus 4]
MFKSINKFSEEDTTQPIIFFSYVDVNYTIYKDFNTIYNDLNLQLQRNFAKVNQEDRELILDFYWNIRHNLLLPSYKIFGFETLNTSYTRLLPTKECYIEFITTSLMDLVYTDTHTNILFKLTIHNPEIKYATLALLNHRAPHPINLFYSKITLISVDRYLQRVFLRYINSNYNYITSINIYLLGENCTELSSNCIHNLYKLTYINKEEYLSKANPLDYIFFISTNLQPICEIVQYYNDKVHNKHTTTVVSYTGNYHTNSLRVLLTWLYDYITGADLFIRSGGESNPGPIIEQIKRWIFDYMRGHMGPMYTVMEETGELAVLSAHLMRLFTSISDAISSFLTGRTLAPVDFTCRISSLILSCYESHSYFSKQIGFRRRATARGQSGPFENILISAVLAYGAPQFIKDLMREIPKFTTTKIMDDASWFYELFGFIISIPRRVLSLFEDDQHEGVISILTDLLLGIEDLFPFSSICRIKREMEVCLSLVDEDPRFAINEANQQRILDVDVRRRKIEDMYKSHKKGFPGYYVNVSERYDALCIKILKYKSDVRIEPVCIVLKGPKGTGKTVLMNRIVQMYKNSGSRVFTDNISASLENKKFYDTYDDEEIYVVDDMGAKSKAQWSEIINQVSSSKYPLDAAHLKNKDTKFFNSQLMLLTCNVMPTSFGSTDGVADKEAFYRRIIMYDFEKVKFTGEYEGSIEVKRYDDTLGIKSFVTVDTFNVDEDTRNFSMRDIDEHISALLQHKVDIYNNNKKTNLLYKGKVFPKGQSLMNDLFRSFDDTVASMPGIDWIVGQMYDLMAIALDKLSTIYQQSSMKNVYSYKYYIMFMTFATAVAGLAIYYKMTEKNEQEKIVDKVHLEYKSNKQPKTTFKQMTAQGFQTMDGELSPSIPQLLPYQRNTCRTKYHYLDRNGHSKSAECRTLFSVDKLLTTFHLFDDADKNKPIYVTAYVGENIIYDYMEVKILVSNSYEDWVILRLPESAPQYMKKIRIPTNNTSFKLYLAAGNNNIYNLEETIGQYTYGIDYTYNNYVGKLTDKDIMYDLEGEGLCGSLLLTKDGRLLGMHVAGLEYYDENDKIYRKGVAKILNNNSYNYIMGIMSLSVNDKANLEFEAKERDISGVYISNNDKCYGVEGTRYVKSPIYGVFPIWRKPALDLPKDKQDYKVLTEAMMKPVETANLEAVEFAEEVLNHISDKQHTNFTEAEIICGNGILNRVNPKTSTGHDLKFNDKQTYLDYENQQLTPLFVEELKTYTDKIVNKQYRYEDAATITSKDELKDVVDPTDPQSQPKKIRIFTNYHLFSTILFRFFFGNLMSYVMEHRNENGIMIGLNPLSKQWDKFARKLTSTNKTVFDGDYANYDKNMHPVFQRRLNAWLINKAEINCENYNKIFKTNYTNQEVTIILEQILECIISTPVLSKNKKFITTHGLPSGTALTAFYNSCINKMYTAYIYRMVAPKEYVDIHTYFRETNLFFYGDDIIGSISDKIKHFYNPISFSKVMTTLGLDFTPAEKGVEWNQHNQFKPLNDCSFLKRTFYFHPKIKSFVAPLNLKSLEGTMNYVSDNGRSTELIMDKMYNFQREMFLHPGDLYNNNMTKLLKACDEKNIRFTPLTEKYLVSCYENNTYSDLLELN